MKQINLKLPENLFDAAERYAERFGFRNLQELAAESMREKIFEKNAYDENFSKEITYTVNEPLEIVAEANCNTHGSNGKVTKKVSLKK